MAGPYQLTPTQQAFLGTWIGSLFGVPPFRVPTGDAVTVNRDTSLAPAGPTPELPPSMTTTRVTVGSLAAVGPPDWSLGGLPVQAVPADAPRRVWTIGSADYGFSTWTLPTPADGLWIEGHPHGRVLPWQTSGAWDRHWIGVYPDRVVEMIRVDPERLTAEKAVEWTPTGQLVRSTLPPWPTGVCRGQVPMHRYVLTRRSLTEPHVLGLAMPDMADGDGRLDDALPFPRYGQRVRLRFVPTDLKGDALTVGRILERHGAVLVDVTGNDGCRIWAQPGAQWAASNLSTLSIPLAAFELCPT